jgi:hypothetical protein
LHGAVLDDLIKDGIWERIVVLDAIVFDHPTVAIAPPSRAISSRARSHRRRLYR